MFLAWNYERVVGEGSDSSRVEANLKKKHMNQWYIT